MIEVNPSIAQKLEPVRLGQISEATAELLGQDPEASGSNVNSLTETFFKPPRVGQISDAPAELLGQDPEDSGSNINSLTERSFKPPRPGQMSDVAAELLGQNPETSGRNVNSLTETFSKPERLGHVSEAAAKLLGQNPVARGSNVNLLPEAFEASVTIRTEQRASKFRSSGRPLMPSSAPRSPKPSNRRHATITFTLFVLATAMVGLLPHGGNDREVTWKDSSGLELASGSAMQADEGLPPSHPTARLIVQDAYAYQGQPARLIVHVQGRSDGTAVLITGLDHGMTLSTGFAFGPISWEMPATEAINAWIGPPEYFVGVVEAIVALRLPGGQIVDRQPIRLQWVERPPPRVTTDGLTVPASQAAAPP
jgi:hypothetical protein